MRLALVTSWNERCGIADYSGRLAAALEQHLPVEIVQVPLLAGPRPVYQAMARALEIGDVAHVQHSYAFFGGLHPLRSRWSAFAGAVRRPLIVTVHELDLAARGVRGLPAPLELAWKRWFNRSVFAHPAIRRWTVHAGEYVEALTGLGVPRERVTYYSMPVPEPPARPGDGAAFQRRLGLERRRVLVIPGFLTRRKGYEVALEALRLLPEQYVLVAAGGEHGADRSGTRAWLLGEAERLGVVGRFRITDYLSEPELEAATAAADLVLAPFREMSASASLNHALARGKAVVASDLPENRRLPCVRLVPVGDAEKLARAIQETCETAVERTRLERAAREYAARHGFAALAEQLLELYRALAPGD